MSSVAALTAVGEAASRAKTAVSARRGDCPSEGLWAQLALYRPGRRVAIPDPPSRVEPAGERIGVLRYFRGSGSLVDVAALAEFSFSDLVQQPTRVASAVEEQGRVVLRRRNAPDLVLSRASDLTELAGFATPSRPGW